MKQSNTNQRRSVFQKDIIDLLTPNQLIELNEALKEADTDQTISWSDFKKELVEWRKRVYRTSKITNQKS
jgi:hypothetical protein